MKKSQNTISSIDRLNASKEHSKPDLRGKTPTKTGDGLRPPRRDTMYMTSPSTIKGSSAHTPIPKPGLKHSAKGFFGDFAAHGAKQLSPDSRAAFKKTFPEMERAVRQYDGHVQSVLADPKVSKASRIFLAELWQGDCFDKPLSMANRHVREALTKAVMVGLLRYADRTPGVLKGARKLRFLTSSPNVGISSNVSGHIDPDAVGRHFDQVMRKGIMEGFAMLDVSLFHDPGQLSESIAIHAHAIIRGRSREFKPKAAEKHASRRLKRNTLGGRIVAVTSGSSKHEGLESVAYLGYYASKLTCGTKVFWQSKSGRQSKGTLEYWGPEAALRMLQIYSHIEPLATIRAVGGAKPLRKRIKELFRRNLQLEKLPRGERIDHVQLELNWAQLYADLGWTPLPVIVA